MARVRNILGSIAGFLLMLSAAAHSLMGWPAQRAALVTAKAPADLIAGLGAGWHFAGAAMLAFGIIVTHTFAGRTRGAPRSLFPVQVAAVLWLLFGAWAWVTTGAGFFGATFVVPGVLLALASFPDDTPHPA